MTDAFVRVTKSAEYIRDKISGPFPKTAVVLGSGLSSVVEDSQVKFRLPYNEIPEFPMVSISGHTGEIVATEYAPEKKILWLKGRIHAYEGYNAHEVVHIIRTVIKCGVENVILTNAAGGLELTWNIGSLMMITDHINGTGMSPVEGQDGILFGQRFTDMTQSYDPNLQKKMIRAAEQNNITLHKGIYYGVSGPQYETPAEIRMMKTLGAHAVGMSTVLETIACRQMGVRVAGLSCITNYGAGLSSNEMLDHAHVAEQGRRVSKNVASLLQQVCLLID